MYVSAQFMHRYTLNIIKVDALIEHDSDGEESGESSSTTHNLPLVTRLLTSHAQSASYASTSKSSTSQCTLQTFSPKPTKQMKYLVASLQNTEMEQQNKMLLQLTRASIHITIIQK